MFARIVPALKRKTVQKKQTAVSGGGGGVNHSVSVNLVTNLINSNSFQNTILANSNLGLTSTDSFTGYKNASARVELPFIFNFPIINLNKNSGLGSQLSLLYQNESSAAKNSNINLGLVIQFPIYNSTSIAKTINFFSVLNNSVNFTTIKNNSLNSQIQLVYGNLLSYQKNSTISFIPKNEFSVFGNGSISAAGNGAIDFIISLNNFVSFTFNKISSTNLVLNNTFTNNISSRVNLNSNIYASFINTTENSSSKNTRATVGLSLEKRIVIPLSKDLTSNLALFFTNNYIGNIRKSVDTTLLIPYSLSNNYNGYIASNISTDLAWSFPFIGTLALTETGSVYYPILMSENLYIDSDLILNLDL